MDENENVAPVDLPAGFLVDNAGLLPRGNALDLAMGRGRNALYLARLGYTVHGVDISEEAVAYALATAEREGLAITADVGDLEGGYSLPTAAYDLIVCINYLQRSLFPTLKQSLRAGGLVVYETFISDQAHLFGKPRNPDFLLQHNELLELFKDFRCLRYREGVFEGRGAVAGIVAQKTARLPEID